MVGRTKEAVTLRLRKRDGAVETQFGWVEGNWCLDTIVQVIWANRGGAEALLEVALVGSAGQLLAATAG